MAAKQFTGLRAPDGSNYVTLTDGAGNLAPGNDPGTAATSLGKAEDAGHTSGDVGVMMLAVRNDTPAALAGTTLDYIPLTTDSLGRLHTAGQLAHDSPQTGNPFRVAGRAATSNYTAVATGDVADIVTTTVGTQIVKPYSIPEGDWTFASAASGIVNTTTAVTIKAAAGAGIRNYLTNMQIATDTLGAATELAIRDGAAGTVIWRGKLQTTALPVMDIEFLTPLRSTANTLLEVVTLTAVTGGVYINAQGYAAP